MAATALVQVEVAQTVKDEVERFLEHEGMTLSDAFRIFLERTAQEQAIPTEVFRPNAETIEAMEEARRGEMPSFNSVEELMAHLNADD